MTPEQQAQKITVLEQQLRTLQSQVAELNRRVEFFVRENNRRKSESAQLANAIKRG